jgi:hypothetical protein
MSRALAFALAALLAACAARTVPVKLRVPLDGGASCVRACQTFPNVRDAVECIEECPGAERITGDVCVPGEEPPGTLCVTAHVVEQSTGSEPPPDSSGDSAGEALGEIFVELLSALLSGSSDDSSSASSSSASSSGPSHAGASPRRSAPQRSPAAPSRSSSRTAAAPRRR